jgi:hypothetical protein
MSLFSEGLDLNRLDARLCNAPALTAGLLSDVVEASCPRLALLRYTERAARAEQMIRSRAWTDAALALLALELPQWQIRRLVYDEGDPARLRRGTTGARAFRPVERTGRTARYPQTL